MARSWIDFVKYGWKYGGFSKLGIHKTTRTVSRLGKISNDCGMKKGTHDGISVGTFWNWWKKCNITLTVGTSEMIQSCNVTLTVKCFFELLNKVATSRQKCGNILELIQSCTLTVGKSELVQSCNITLTVGCFCWTAEKRCNITA